jgi:hypothetical protein
MEMGNGGMKPVIGRDRELAMADRLLDDLTDGTGSILYLEGEPPTAYPANVWGDVDRVLDGVARGRRECCFRKAQACLRSGEGGIRTLEAGITRPRDFQSRSLSRSDTSPGTVASLATVLAAFRG